MYLVDDEPALSKQPFARENPMFTAEGLEVIDDVCEGHFRVVTWHSYEAGVYGVSFIGRQEEATWSDESDSGPKLCKALRTIEILRAERFVWDFTLLEFLSPDGLLYIEDSMSRIAGTTCAVARTYDSPLKINGLLSAYLYAGSREKAILLLCPAAGLFASDRR